MHLFHDSSWICGRCSRCSLESEITAAIYCFPSFVNGICWTYNYHYTKASYSICWAQGVGPRMDLQAIYGAFSSFLHKFH
uniref:Uncharacterized protein MANES_08G053600 n=1 Tax=Rhizophora mucronata TaxID=61149 RepID=A0A2P2MF01_RHIMU